MGSTLLIIGSFYHWSHFYLKSFPYLEPFPHQEDFLHQESFRMLPISKHLFSHWSISLNSEESMPLNRGVVLPQENHLLCNISYLWTYDLHGPVRTAFDADNSITRASGRGLGPGN
jgi:hypothetical protein